MTEDGQVPIGAAQRTLVAHFPVKVSVLSAKDPLRTIADGTVLRHLSYICRRRGGGASVWRSDELEVWRSDEVTSSTESALAGHPTPTPCGTPSVWTSAGDCRKQPELRPEEKEGRR